MAMLGCVVLKKGDKVHVERAQHKGTAQGSWN